MENKALRSRLRSEFGKQGLALLVYYGIMNACVTAAAVVDAIVYALASDSVSMDTILERITGNGWGYILSCLIGGVILLAWKRTEFCFRTIWKPGKPLKIGSFFAITSIFISGQLVFQVLAVLLEWLMNLMGLSLLESMEAATMSVDTLSMFLYMGVFAPVFEEILFRGLVMRSLEPYGRKFAIFASAFLFGIFHGNPIQSPYAFAVGLVLGYTAMEHNIAWAMVLHMLNNLVLGDSMVRLTSGLGTALSDLIFWVVIIGCSIAAVIVCIRKRREIGAYFREGKIHPLCLKYFFTSPGILAITAVMVGNMLLMLLMQLFV